MNASKSNIEEKALELARQIGEYQEVDVVGVSLMGKGKGMLLRVTIDKEGGVTLQDCENFSREMESLLEAGDILQEHYNLEVSSPGLDRPLTALADFKKNIGRLVRVVTSLKIDNQSFFVGRIAGVYDNVIGLSIGKKEIKIAFENISKARLEIEIR